MFYNQATNHWSIAMKFNVTNIRKYNDRCNVLTLEFSVGTDIDGKAFTAFAPSSLQVSLGICDLPKWYVDGLFGNKRQNVIDGIMRSCHKDKRSMAFYNNICSLVDAASALNVETPVHTAGNYIGEKGEEFFMLPLTVEKCLFSEERTSDRWEHRSYGMNLGAGWTHPTYCKELWQLKDDNGNVAMISTTRGKLQEILHDNLGKKVVATGVIESLGEFRGTKQTFLRSNKLQLDAFQEA